MHNYDQNHCLNCQHPLLDDDKYCPNCSQKVIKKIPSVMSILSDIFGSVFNINTKIFNTLRYLFIPGKLTSLFFQGKQQSLYSPFKILFVIIFLFISALSISGFKDKMLSKLMVVNHHDSFIQDRYIEKLDTTDFVQKFDDPALVQAVLDTMRNDIGIYGDSITMTVFTQVSLKVSERDVHSMTPVELVNTYGIQDFKTRYTVMQISKFIKSPGNFTWYIISNLFWVILLVTPITAAFMFILYLRKRRYFVEHLVFLMHCAAFVFIIFTILIAAAQSTPTMFLSSILWPAIPIYLLLAQKRYYTQGWIKTFIKHTIVVTAYMIFSIISFIIISSLALSIF